MDEGEVMEMTLSPFRSFMDLQGEMNRLFEDMFGGPVRRQGRQGELPARWTPAADVVSRDGNLVIRAELPGVAPEDVDITLENGVLTISGERRAEREEGGEGYYVKELRYGSFRRSMRLPEGVGEEKIHARFENGVLEVTVEDAAAVEEPKRIQIEGPGG